MSEINAVVPAKSTAEERKSFNIKGKRWHSEVK